MDEYIKVNMPDYIEEIPTSRKAMGERKMLIANYYDELWRKLQKEKGVLAVYNDYLGVDVYVVKNESDKKTAFEASIGNQPMPLNIFILLYQKRVRQKECNFLIQRKAELKEKMVINELPYSTTRLPMKNWIT